MGYKESSDAHQKICIVPIGDSDDQFYYPVPGTGKPNNQIGYICADGSFHKLTGGSPRKAYDEDSELLGFQTKCISKN
jgi:hypothetical protein